MKWHSGSRRRGTLTQNYMAAYRDMIMKHVEANK